MLRIIREVIEVERRATAFIAENDAEPSPTIEVCLENPTTENAYLRSVVRDSFDDTWGHYSALKFTGCLKNPGRFTMTAFGVVEHLNVIEHITESIHAPWRVDTHTQRKSRLPSLSECNHRIAHLWFVSSVSRLVGASVLPQQAPQPSRESRHSVGRAHWPHAQFL